MSIQVSFSERYYNINVFGATNIEEAIEHAKIFFLKMKKEANGEADYLVLDDNPAFCTWEYVEPQPDDWEDFYSFDVSEKTFEYSIHYKNF